MRESINHLADDMFGAIERGDLNTLAALWSDDIVVWRLGGGRERDKTRALKVIDWFVAGTAVRRYEVLDRRVFDGGFVQQHLLHAVSLDGTQLSVRACLVVKADADGLATRIDEYLDPAVLTSLTTLAGRS